ncbi:MAG TPA: Holliday junction branch migration protein RuvA [Planctomycetes bacterium]|nr:Holliday junction branch migration protein RuvA [Planctomycetota bacterium]
MYHHVRGTLVAVTPSTAVVEAGGLGFQVEIPFPVVKELDPRIGSEVFLYVVPYFREDTQRMFGFLSETDRDYFELIMSVRGLGPAHALALLSGLSAAEIHGAIAKEKPEILRQVRGIGAKTAERIVMELREKLPFPPPGAEETAMGDETETARLALQGIGYSRQESVAAVKKALDALPGAGAAEWIKHALRTRP